MEKSPIQEIFFQTTHVPAEIHAIDKMPCSELPKNDHVCNFMKKKGLL